MVGCVGKKRHHEYGQSISAMVEKLTVRKYNYKEGDHTRRVSTFGIQSSGVAKYHKVAPPPNKQRSYHTHNLNHVIYVEVKYFGRSNRLSSDLPISTFPVFLMIYFFKYSPFENYRKIHRKSQKKVKID